MAVAKIDLTDATDIASTFEIQGFPTLKLFSNKLVYNYEGERTLKALKEFAEGGYKKLTPSKLPSDMTFVDHAMKNARLYVEKVIINFN